METAIEIVRISLEIVGVASILAAYTPTKKDDKFLAVLREVLDYIAFNIGNARNK